MNDIQKAEEIITRLQKGIYPIQKLDTTKLYSAITKDEGSKCNQVREDSFEQRHVNEICIAVDNNKSFDDMDPVILVVNKLNTAEFDYNDIVYLLDGNHTFRARYQMLDNREEYENINDEIEESLELIDACIIPASDLAGDFQTICDHIGIGLNKYSRVVKPMKSADFKRQIERDIASGVIDISWDPKSKESNPNESYIQKQATIYNLRVHSARMTLQSAIKSHNSVILNANFPTPEKGEIDKVAVSIELEDTSQKTKVIKTIPRQAHEQAIGIALNQIHNFNYDKIIILAYANSKEEAERNTFKKANKIVDSLVEKGYDIELKIWDRQKDEESMQPKESEVKEMGGIYLLTFSEEFKVDNGILVDKDVIKVGMVKRDFKNRKSQYKCSFKNDSFSMKELVSGTGKHTQALETRIHQQLREKGNMLRTSKGANSEYYSQLTEEQIKEVVLDEWSKTQNEQKSLQNSTT